MEWIALVLGAVGGGLLTALVTPPAQRRAVEAKLRTDARRDLVANGRTLIFMAARDGWSDSTVIQDPRCLALKRHLSKETVRLFPAPLKHPVPVLGSGSYSPLLKALVEDIDRLEKKWRLT